MDFHGVFFYAVLHKEVFSTKLPYSNLQKRDTNQIQPSAGLQKLNTDPWQPSVDLQKHNNKPWQASANLQEFNTGQWLLAVNMQKTRWKRATCFCWFTGVLYLLKDEIEHRYKDYNRPLDMLAEPRSATMCNHATSHSHNFETKKAEKNTSKQEKFIGIEQIYQQSFGYIKKTYYLCTDYQNTTLRCRGTAKINEENRPCRGLKRRNVTNSKIFVTSSKKHVSHLNRHVANFLCYNK